MRRLAEWAGVAVDDIQQMNPELRRWTTPVRGAGYTLTVPSGSGDAIRERLQTTSPNELNALQWHVVKRGETMATILRARGRRSTG